MSIKTIALVVAGAAIAGAIVEKRFSVCSKVQNRVSGSKNQAQQSEAAAQVAAVVNGAK